MSKLISFVAVVGLVAACGSSSKKTPAPAGGSNGAGSGTQTTAPDIGEGVAWADKTFKQKAAFMKTKVVPAVAAIWKESPEPNEEVECSTCHNAARMANNDFKMPNEKLPSLNPADQFAAHKDKGEWLAFMGKKLAPTMVQTLGVEPFDMKTMKGFGCFSCHTMAKGQ